MKAMIFAAGLGTRLYPITKDRPKALAEVNGVTLLEHNIRFLVKHGFDDIIINAHHFSEKVVEFIDNHGIPDVMISLSIEEDLLDTAGGLAYATSFFDNEDFLLYNVDVISDINLREMMIFHKQHNALASLAVRKRITSRYLLFDSDMRMQGWRNETTGERINCSESSKELTDYAFSGIHMVSPKIFDLLGEPRKHSLTPFYLNAAKEEVISGFDHSSDVWFDCGKPETLALADKYLKNL